MPLEINEIAIQMQVREEGRGAESFEAAESGAKTRIPAGCGEDMEMERSEIVEDCVRRVLQALKTLRER